MADMSAPAFHVQKQNRSEYSLLGTKASVVDLCGQTLRGDGMVLTSHRDSRRFYFVVAGTDCRVTMEAASPEDRLQFQFRFFLVYSMLRLPPSTPPPGASQVPLTRGSPLPSGEQGPPDPCAAGSYVQFYDGRGPTAKPLGAPLCGKSIPRPILSTGGSLTLRLVTRGQQPRVDFVADFTSLRTGLNASACGAASYFPCRNGKCIPRSLVCDGSQVDNCGDGTDQAAQPPARCQGLPTLPPAALQAETPPRVSAHQADQESCTGAQEGRRLPPAAANQGPAADKRPPLFAWLAALLGAALLFWCCCCNPGWLLWRVGACRFLPGCNSACAAGHLCTHSCARRREPTKVTPQGTAAEPPA
ncbi:low-density lipoprotein receptor class A domain-containing protein 2 [Hemicordylus capensis]|uniref:low-density lipoprotein receptor class A domain-containing protein 2 n=1 Tax=Hemicordylus capensis TaxID=884348 RepID=UPI00230356CC|nr:low-density lipoprotein receptor class A domain-containing protein 2 [Hemicordylus capensis]